VNLTEWAHVQGIHVTTAYRWYREGTLPVPARKVGGLILVSPDTAATSPQGGAGLYARVSCHDQKADLAAHGRRLVVLEDSEVTDDLVRDMIEVLTSFCARLYGRRSARNRALKAVGCAQRDIGPQAVLTAESVPCGGRE
jgi:predicted site-specific integrase-resolvase